MTILSTDNCRYQCIWNSWLTLHSLRVIELLEERVVQVPQVFWHIFCILVETAQLPLNFGHDKKLSFSGLKMIRFEKGSVKVQNLFLYFLFWNKPIHCEFQGSNKSRILTQAHLKSKLNPLSLQNTLFGSNWARELVKPSKNNFIFSLFVSGCLSRTVLGKRLVVETVL